ncbi:unnamed protein product [Rotaria magnacalcarata]
MWHITLLIKLYDQIKITYYLKAGRAPGTAGRVRFGFGCQKIQQCYKQVFPIINLIYSCTQPLSLFYLPEIF